MDFGFGSAAHYLSVPRPVPGPGLEVPVSTWPGSCSGLGARGKVIGRESQDLEGEGLSVRQIHPFSSLYPFPSAEKSS